MRPWRFVDFTEILEVLSAYLEDGSTDSSEDFVHFYQITRRHIQQDGTFITGVTSSHFPRFTVTKINNRRLDNTVSCE